MDQSTALHRLLEASDLVRMVEDLIQPGNYERLSPSAISGLRITLRNLRENVLTSHDVLAGDLVNRARARMESTQIIQTEESLNDGSAQSNARGESPSIVRGAGPFDPERVAALRGKKDLRASIDQSVERV